MKWRNVKDELPPHDAQYIVCCESADENSPYIGLAWYEPDYGWSLLPQCWIDAITHWMPLPKPPYEIEGTR